MIKREWMKSMRVRNASSACLIVSLLWPLSIKPSIIMTLNLSIARYANINFSENFTRNSFLKRRKKISGNWMKIWRSALIYRLKKRRRDINKSVLLKMTTIELSSIELKKRMSMKSSEKKSKSNRILTLRTTCYFRWVNSLRVSRVALSDPRAV